MRTLPSPEALFGSLLRRPMGKPPWGRILRGVRSGSVTGLAASIGAGLGLWVGLGLVPNQIEIKDDKVAEAPEVQEVWVVEELPVPPTVLPAEINGPKWSAWTDRITQAEPKIWIKKDPEPPNEPLGVEPTLATPKTDATAPVVKKETAATRTEHVETKPLRGKEKSEPKTKPPPKPRALAESENPPKAGKPADPAKPNIFTRIFGKKEDSKKMLARVTVYWAKGGGTDSWSAKKQSATGVKLSGGEHAAVDPKVIPYGSSVKIKNPESGETRIVKAVDTGGDVKNRKAAVALGKTETEKKAPVIDLFFENRSEALAYASRNPHFQWVDIVAN